MSVTRFAWPFLTALIVLLAADTVTAQPTANQLLQPQTWQKALPSDPGGQAITDGDRVWAYVAGVLGFLFVFVFARVAVRVLAYIAYLLLVLGGAGVICSLISDNSITTWQMLGLTAAAVGGYCGVTSVVVGLFMLSQDDEKSGSDQSGLQKQLEGQRVELNRLASELAGLKEQLTRRTPKA